MADLFPVRQGDNVLYNATDVITGRSFQTLYLGATTVTTPTIGYHLTGYTWDATPPNTAYTPSGDGVTFRKDGDTDFDITVNKHISIEGTAIMNFSWQLTTTGNSQTYIIVKMRKYDGTTETDLGSATTVTQVNNGNVRESLPISIAKTHFKVGDIMRVTVELWLQTNVGSTTHTDLLHDPTDRTEALGGYEDVFPHSSIASIKIPFIVKD